VAEESDSDETDRGDGSKRTGCSDNEVAKRAVRAKWMRVDSDREVGEGKNNEWVRRH